MHECLQEEGAEKGQRAPEMEHQRKSALPKDCPAVKRVSELGKGKLSGA